uniref:Uncharacterized protein n=1 Tax=Setaria digitata TaxID=48799 RepID=A0A915PGU7_9BILA
MDRRLGGVGFWMRERRRRQESNEKENLEVYYKERKRDREIWSMEWVDGWVQLEDDLVSHCPVGASVAIHTRVNSAEPNVVTKRHPQYAYVMTQHSFPTQGRICRVVLKSEMHIVGNGDVLQHLG